MQKELSCNETEDIVMCLILRMGALVAFLFVLSNTLALQD